MKSLLSRKFILTVGMVVTGLLVAVYPDHEDTITSIVTQIGGFAISILVTLGWLVIQGADDREATRSAGRVNEHKAMAAETPKN